MDEQMNVLDGTQEPVVEAHETVEQPSEQVENSVTPEVAEPEQPRQTPEENAQYAKIRRDAEAKAMAKAQADFDAKIAALLGETHGINSFAEYERALQAEREQQRQQDQPDVGYEAVPDQSRRAQA